MQNLDINVQKDQSNSLFESGMNNNLFPLPLEMDCKMSKYLICMAAFEFKISAALCISLALYTSAEAEIIFALDKR